MKLIACPHCGDTYPDFDVAHMCSRGPYAPQLKPRMNERIRQLAEQVYGTQATEQEIKFAELIVRECILKMDIVYAKALVDGIEGPDTFLNGVNVSIEAVNQHFGVEEQVQDSKELHTCPYREEIHNDYESLCDCNEEQQHQCAMDI